MIRKIRYEIEFDFEEEAKAALAGVDTMLSMVIKSTPNLEAMASTVIPIEKGYKVVGEGILKEKIGVGKNK